MFKLASFPTWVTGSAFQLVSFPPAWPLKWTSILQKQTLYSANLIIALRSWSSGSSFLQFRRQLMSLAHILSLSLSSVHFLLRTDTLEIETCDFLELCCCFFLFIPLSLDFYWNFSLLRMPFFSITVRNLLLDSLYLCLYLSISVSVSIFVSLCLCGVYGNGHRC